MKLLHRIAHLLRWNSRQQENWMACNGRLMTGYRCHYCGKLTDIRPVPMCERRY